jgi:hypothetical protein
MFVVENGGTDSSTEDGLIRDFYKGQMIDE